MSVQHATGPVTEEGKARSSQNALSHGLTAKDLYVPTGQQEEFDLFQQALETDLCPTTPAEFLLFHHIVSASWRLRRCDQAEAQLTSATGLDPLLDPALAPTLRTLDRTRTQASKLLHKSLTELRRLQTEHHYRTVAMPADEGCDTTQMGLADSQIIRTRMKKEEALDGLNHLRRRHIDSTRNEDTFNALYGEALKPPPDTSDDWDNDPGFADTLARADRVAAQFFGKDRS